MNPQKHAKHKKLARTIVSMRKELKEKDVENELLKLELRESKKDFFKIRKVAARQVEEIIESVLNITEPLSIASWED